MISLNANGQNIKSLQQIWVNLNITPSFKKFGKVQAIVGLGVGNLSPIVGVKFPLVFQLPFEDFWSNDADSRG